MVKINGRMEGKYDERNPSNDVAIPMVVVGKTDEEVEEEIEREARAVDKYVELIQVGGGGVGRSGRLRRKHLTERVMNKEQAVFRRWK